jgi:hypothetical protein
MELRRCAINAITVRSLTLPHPLTVPIQGQLSSRGMIGDGVIDVTGVTEQVLAQEHDGFVEVEILSDHWWSQTPEHTLDVIRDRFQQL